MSPNQLPLGLLEKSKGQTKAIQNPRHDEWKEKVELEIRTIAALGIPFTADHIIAACGLPTASVANKNNAVGAMISAMSARRVIRKTGRYVQSTRKASHARMIAEWIGTPSYRNGEAE